VYHDEQSRREKLSIHKISGSILQRRIFAQWMRFCVSIQNPQSIIERNLRIGKRRFWFIESPKSWWHIKFEILHD